jgi:hypothetical protein
VAASIAAATALTWSINRQVTFRPTVRRRREQLARYASVALVAQGTNYALFLGFERLGAPLAFAEPDPRVRRGFRRARLLGTAIVHLSAGRSRDRSY